jgi:ubiquinone/menaquinone biosynthesis C-methylase UbiE
MFGLLLLEHISLQSGIRALDVACGTGFPLIELAQRLGPSSKVVGIDIWEAALKRALTKAGALGVHTTSLACGDSAHLPFADRSFDLIVSNLGINNFDFPEDVFSECYRVAKPGAHIALSTNLQGHMQELYDLYEFTLQEIGLEEYIPDLHKQAGERVTIERASELLAKAGFRISQTHQKFFTMRYADALAFFNSPFIQASFLDGWRSVVPLDLEKEIFSRLVEKLGRGELRLTVPAGYIEGIK